MIAPRFFNTIGFALLLASFRCFGSEGLINSDLNSIGVNDSIASTILSISSEQGQWFTYQVDMEPDNGMPCCLVNDSTSICNLEKRSNDWSSSSDNRENSKTLDVYFKKNGQQLSDLFYAGSECTVDANENTVYEINGVTQEQSVLFLNDLISHKGTSPDNSKRQLDHNKHISNKALAGVAMHKGSEAHTLLESFTNSEKKQLRHQSIFWLGQARNKPGYESLLGIIDDGNRDTKSRTDSVFALSVNNYEGSTQKLVEFGRSHRNDKIQAESIFWLAQNHEDKAGAVIKHVLNNNNTPHVKKKAIVSLSQMKTKASWQQLVSLAQSSEDRAIQEEAIFWLSQDEENEPVAVLMGLIEADNPKAVKNKAIFSLSQLPSDQSTPALINLINTTPEKYLRKKALFWLGQSNDPKSIEFLENILTAAHG